MGYTIGKLERTHFLDARGRGTDGYRVWYQMENGTVDYIEIEKSQYSAENVKAAIEKEIKTHEELMS